MSLEKSIENYLPTPKAANIESRMPAFIRYLVVLLRRVHATHTISDPLIIELQESVQMLHRTQYRQASSKPSPHLSDSERSLVKETEAQSFAMLKELLLRVTMKTSRDKGVAEKELKCARLMQAYCNLKTLHDEVENEMLQRDKLCRSKTIAQLLNPDNAQRTAGIQAPVYAHSISLPKDRMQRRLLVAHLVLSNRKL